MCINSLPNYNPGISQQEFKNKIIDNLPVDKKELDAINNLLLSEQVIIEEVSFSGSGFFDTKNKYKNRIKYKKMGIENSEFEILYNAHNGK